MLRHQLIHPKINEVLGRAGHHAKVLIADGNYPASSTLGPNATLIAGDFEKMIRRLKAELAGEIHVGGPVLAQSLSEASLIDEYRLYLRPVVLGGGQPFFAGPRPPLHLVASDLIADDVIRLSYVPA